MANEDEWRADAAALLEFESVYETALSAAEELDDSDIDFGLETKKRHAPKLRKIVSFYMWANLMLEESMVLLFLQELVPDEYNDETVGEYLRSRHINFQHLMEFLYRAGVFAEYTDSDNANGLKSELSRCQNIRNKLAHRSRQRALLNIDNIDTDNLSNDIERMYSTFEKIQDMLESKI